jgi:hypothetical protein
MRTHESEMADRKPGPDDDNNGWHWYAHTKLRHRRIRKQQRLPAALKKYQAFMIAFKRPGKKAEVLRWWASRGRR